MNTSFSSTNNRFKSICDRYIQNIHLNIDFDISMFIQEFDNCNFPKTGTTVLGISDDLFNFYSFLNMKDKLNVITEISNYFGFNKFMLSIPPQHLSTLIHDNLGLPFHRLPFDSFHLNVPIPLTPENCFNVASSIFSLCFVHDYYLQNVEQQVMLAYNLQSFLNDNMLNTLPQNLYENGVCMCLSLRASFDQLNYYARQSLAYDPKTNAPIIQKTALYVYDGTTFQWRDAGLRYFNRFNQLVSSFYPNIDISLFENLNNDFSVRGLYQNYLAIKESTKIDFSSNNDLELPVFY